MFESSLMKIKQLSIKAKRDPPSFHDGSGWLKRCNCGFNWVSLTLNAARTVDPYRVWGVSEND